MWKTKTATISIVVGTLGVNIRKGTEKQFGVINQIAGRLGSNSHGNSTHSQNVNFHKVISGRALFYTRGLGTMVWFRLR